MRRTVSVLILSCVTATTGVPGGVEVPGARVQALAAPAAPACADGWGDPALPFPGEYKAKVSGSWTQVDGSITSHTEASGQLTFVVSDAKVTSVTGTFAFDVVSRNSHPDLWATETSTVPYRILGTIGGFSTEVWANVRRERAASTTDTGGGGWSSATTGGMKFLVDSATCTTMKGHVQNQAWQQVDPKVELTWIAEPTAATLANYTKAMEEVRRQAQGAQGLPRKQINTYLGALIDEIKRSSDPAKECKMKVVIEEAVKISQGAMNDILAEMQQQIAALRKGEVPLAAAMVKFRELMGEYVSFDKSRVFFGCPSQLEQLIAPVLEMSKLAAKAHDMKDAVELDRLAVLLGSDASAAIPKAAKEMADAAFKEMKDNWASASPEESLRLANEARASEKASDILSGTSDAKAKDWACSHLECS